MFYRIGTASERLGHPLDAHGSGVLAQEGYFLLVQGLPRQQANAEFLRQVGHRGAGDAPGVGEDRDFFRQLGLRAAALVHLAKLVLAVPREQEGLARTRQRSDRPRRAFRLACRRLFAAATSAKAGGMGNARGEASRAFHAEIHFGHGLLLLSASVLKSRDSRLLKGLADGSSAHRGVHLRSNIGLPGHVEYMADML